MADVELRDWFAGMALPGLLIARSKLDESDEQSTSWMMICGTGALTNTEFEGKPMTWAEGFSMECYELADAMLKERAK